MAPRVIVRLRLVANVDQMRAACERAAQRGARFTVFPEFAMAKHADLTPEALSQAEPVDGPFTHRVARLAVEYGQTIVAGMLEQDGADVYNTLIGVDASGDVVATYRKVHLYDAYGQRESDSLRAGDPEAVATMDVDGVRVGLLTCYDLRFPESARLHANAGTQLLLYPANWVPGEHKRLHWETLARARAIENTLFVAAVSQAPPTGIGTSVLVDPAGLDVVRLGDEPGVVVADVASGRVATVRDVNPSLANRRYTVAARNSRDQ